MGTVFDWNGIVVLCEVDSVVGAVFQRNPIRCMGKRFNIDDIRKAFRYGVLRSSNLRASLRLRRLLRNEQLLFFGGLFFYRREEFSRGPLSPAFRFTGQAIPVNCPSTDDDETPGIHGLKRYPINLKGRNQENSA